MQTKSPHPRLALVLGLAVVCAVVFVGVAFAVEVTQREEIIVQTTSRTALAAHQSKPVTVMRLALGPGNWIVTASAHGVGLNQRFADIRCAIEGAGAALASASTAVGSAGGQRTMAEDAFTAAIKLVAQSTVANVCSWDAASAGSGSYYIEPGATMTASKVDKLTTLQTP